MKGFVKKPFLVGTVASVFRHADGRVYTAQHLEGSDGWVQIETLISPNPPYVKQWWNGELVTPTGGP